MLGRANLHQRLEDDGSTGKSGVDLPVRALDEVNQTLSEPLTVGRLGSVKRRGENVVSDNQGQSGLRI